jgi:hypothetical protein
MVLFARFASATARMGTFSRPLKGRFGALAPIHVATGRWGGGAFGTAAAVEVVLTGGIPRIGGVFGGVTPRETGEGRVGGGGSGCDWFCRGWFDINGG